MKYFLFFPLSEITSKFILVSITLENELISFLTKLKTKENVCLLIA